MTKHMSTANTHSSHYPRAFTLTFGLLRNSFFFWGCIFVPPLTSFLVRLSYRIITYGMYTIDTYGLVASMSCAHVIALNWCTYYYGEHIINVKMCQGNLILVYPFPSG